MNFNPELLFTKGIAYGEFFDIASDNLVGFSRYITEFSPNGSMNDGAVEGGPGNMLIMNIPDTARLSITAKTADSSLDNMGLTIGAEVKGDGIIETSAVLTATGTSLGGLTAAVAPPGGQNGAIAYVLSSTGSDKAAVAAGSGTAYAVNSSGTITGFTAVSGASYCVKYFTKNSSAEQLAISALFAPKVVRAHFAVYCYSKTTGKDVLASSLYKIRHYYIPRYFFTNPLVDSLGQTTTGSVDLSGNALTYDEAADMDACASTSAGAYGYIVDEYVGNNTSTAAVDGIYFVGAGAGVSVGKSATIDLVAKYSVNDSLVNISDMSQVEFSTAAAATAKFNDSHSPVLSGVAAGSTTATVKVTNSRTGVVYQDTIPVTVT